MNRHLSSRRLSQLGFLLGVAAGGLAYLAVEKHEISFVLFVCVWYLLAYGVTRARTHAEHRADWLVHIALFPALWVIGVVVIQTWLIGDLLAAVVLGALLAALLQAGLTTVVLRRVRADQLHDMRRKLGIE